MLLPWKRTTATPSAASTSSCGTGGTAKWPPRSWPRHHLPRSLGTHADGIAGFLRYVDAVRTAAPDFHNQVDELITAGDTVVVRLTCSGTLRGPLFGVPGTGRRITYAAIAILRLRDDLIRDAWVVGDTQELWRALGAVPPPTT